MYTFLFFFVLSMILLSDRDVSAATLRLTWRDTSTNESGFKVERLSGANYVEIARVGANVQVYSDTTAVSNENYCYRVRAFNAGGVSTPTNAACATAPSGTTSGGSTAPLITPKPPPVPRSVPPIQTSSSGSSWKDYLLRATLRSTDNDAFGVMFRYQDPNNYYRFSWSAEGQHRRLEKRVGGVFQVLAQDTAVYNNGKSYALQVSARGSLLTVAIDGKTIFSVKDTSVAQGTIGLYSYRNSGSYFDDIHVQDLQTGNTLAVDDFNNGGHVGWTIIDEGGDAVSSKWSVSQGVLVQSSNIGSTGDNEKLGTYALYTRGSWTDYRVALKMRSSDNDRLGVLFRFQDSDNYYRFSWDQESPGRRLYKREKGVFKLLAQDAVPYVINHTYNVEMVAQGNALKVNVDGKAVFAVNDSTFRGGAVGLYSSSNQSSYFDDLLIEDLTSKVVLLWEDFSDNNLAGWNAFDEAGTTGGPSRWTVSNGTLVQTSNIGSGSTGHPGTFLLY